MAQGADLKTEQYIKIMSTLQNSVDFPLWVGIPQCPMDVAAIPKGLEAGIKRVTKTMKEEGMKAEFEFYAGHSLGGAMMPDYVKDNVADSADGQILMGAFLTRKFKTATTPEGRPQVEFPVSTLTIGGELDGLCRISRVTEALYSQVTFAADPSSARDFLPVTVIPGMNHMEFASGEIPVFVLDSDLQAEISEDQAQKEAVFDMSAFLNSKVYPEKSEYIETMRARVAESTEFTQPIVDAFLMESYEQFLPPCYCEAEVHYITIPLHVSRLTLLCVLCVFCAGRIWGSSVRHLRVDSVLHRGRGVELPVLASPHGRTGPARGERPEHHIS